jgi:hypothetical protein
MISGRKSMNEFRLKSKALGRRVFDWKEFIRLANRLGIDMTRSTRSVTITIAVDEVVVVEQEYIGEDNGNG